VAERNAVTIFERAKQPGGAFRYAGKAPLFQEVVANHEPFDRYVRDLAAACVANGAVLRCGIDVGSDPDLLRPFDRIVIATGARYRFGLGPIANAMLDGGAGRWPVFRQALSSTWLRDWLYHRGRKPTGAALQRLARPEQKVVVIGDALRAGKSRPAILSAFEAAFRS